MLYYIGEHSIVLFHNGERFIINKDQRKYDKILDAIKNKLDDDKIIDILNDETQVASYINELSIFDGVEIFKDGDCINVKIDGEIINEELAKLIVRHYNAGVEFKHFIKFFKKLRDNPSKHVFEQLCKFIASSMKSGGFMIDEDGDIIAYKKIRNDYKDIYSGKFDNSIGSIVKMRRNEVCEDSHRTCSNGLHFCAFSYLEHYSSSINDRVVIVKVNPKNVVSIPDDYDNAKARCCEYKVIGELEKVNSPLPDEVIYRETNESIEDLKEDENHWNTQFYNFYVSILTKFKSMKLKDKRDVYCNIIDKNAHFKKFESHQASIKRLANFLNKCNLNTLIDIDKKI